MKRGGRRCRFRIRPISKGRNFYECEFCFAGNKGLSLILLLAGIALMVAALVLDFSGKRRFTCAALC